MGGNKGTWGEIRVHGMGIQYRQQNQDRCTDRENEQNESRYTVCVSTI